MFALKFLTSLSVFMVFGCASNTAPRGWLPTAEGSQQDAYGGWITVEYADSNHPKTVDGELLAVMPEKILVYAALAERSHVAEIAISQISYAKLTGWDAESDQFGIWTVGGTISTISHGFYLILTAPIWIISGSIAASSQSHHPQMEYPKKDLKSFSPYARFPQGIPDGLDVRLLKVKI